jgi:ligand-binding sensor domain-containing protein
MGGPYGIQWHPDVNIKMDGNYYDQLPSIRVRAIAEAPNGNIWVGTENGIAIFNNSDWSNSSAVLPDPFVTAIAFDKAGTAWVGTKKGLVSIK